jgi:hypothetical protein
MENFKHFHAPIVMLCTTVAFTASLASCSNDFDAVESVDEFVGEEIKVCSFPALTIDATTRAVDEKSSWDSNDVIYVQVNGEGKWYALTYADGLWSAPEGFNMKKNDSYKAVYAPNYVPDAAKNALVLKSGAVASTAEYLTCEGIRPIVINFTRNYSRLRLSATANTSIPVSFGEGFTANDGSGVKSFSLTTDGDGDAYVYGKWSAETKLDIEGAVEGNPSEDAVYVVKNQLSNNIANASVASKAYHVAAESYIVYNIDKATTADTEMSGVDFKTYRKLKVIGAWDEEKKPTISTDLTTVDLSEVTGMTSVPDSYFQNKELLTHVDLPNSITSIGANAFDSDYNLVMPELPSSVESIGEKAFNNCKSLAIESLPSSLKTLGHMAFLGSYVKLSTLPSGITSFSTCVFYECIFDSNILFEWPSASDGNTCLTSMPKQTFDEAKGLTAVVIPADVTSLLNWVFWGCGDLETVICRAATAPSLGLNVFKSIRSNAVLYVPTGSYESYSSAWKYCFGGGVQELSDEEMDALITKLRNRSAESE